VSVSVDFIKVSKTFQKMKAVIDVNLNIKPGEFFSLLGPSGCGKTTTLRLLAGFEQPDEDGGEVKVGDKVVNKLRPYDRGLGMVFQSYALFPHLNIESNIAFGLEQRDTPRSEIASRVTKAMEMVRLSQETFGRRLPAQLSGGQRQRVALARALVINPPLLLLDEPLGALDLKLRKEMQYELKEINRRLGVTFVYVTHDQEEALTMSDRIAVMDQARVAQVGSPAEIYEKPRTAFVAKFIGESNFLEGDASDSQEGKRKLSRKGGDIWVNGTDKTGNVKVAIRPERIALQKATPENNDAYRSAPTSERENVLKGKVLVNVYRGEMMHTRVELEGGVTILAAARNEGQLHRPLPWKEGDNVNVAFRAEDCHVLEQ
jgi:spermidine/putrescine transport system ATP-binding protein